MNKNSLAHMESINRIIDYLYSSVDLSIHNRIINFFCMLMDEIYFDKATIMFFFRGEDGNYEKKSSINLNWDKEWTKKYTKYYSKIDDVLPVLDQSRHIMFRTSQFFDQQKREQTKYYKEFLYPNDCIYSIEGNILLPESIDLRAEFTLSRGRDKNDFTEDDLKLLRLFQCHLSNVFSFYQRDSFSFELETLLDNYNSIAIGILDNNFEVIRSNSTFQKVMTKHETDNREKNILENVKKLCRMLATNRTELNRMTYEQKLDDTSFFIEASIIKKGKEEGRQEFCCLIYDLSYFFWHAILKAEETYHLNQREIDILKYLMKGYNNEQIAQELFFSVTTVKRYTAVLYEKMQIKSYKQIFEKLNLLHA